MADRVEQTRPGAAMDQPDRVPAQTTLVGASVASIADPGPLGLGAFAMTTFVLSVFNANIIKTPGLSGVVLPLALFYGGTAQLLAGMWEFRKANTFGALAFTSFGAFWLSYFFLGRYVAASLPAANAYEAVGLFLLGWTIFTGYMCIGAVKVSGAVLAVFVFLFATFLALTIGALLVTSAGLPSHAGSDVTHIGGYLGIITAALAWYASLAGVTNATWGRVIFPVFPANR